MMSIKNMIVKSNNWYDNLPEPKRTLFFFFVIMGSFILFQFLFFNYNQVWAFPIWALIFAGWRIAAVFLNWRDWYKKKTDEN